MTYCLSHVEINLIVESSVENKNIDDDELNLRVQQANVWSYELVALSYLFSFVVEKQDSPDYINKLIDVFYSLPNSMYLSIQEFNSDFIDFMIKNLRDENLLLHENLVEIQNRLGEHSYDKNLRY